MQARKPQGTASGVSASAARAIALEGMSVSEGAAALGVPDGDFAEALVDSCFEFGNDPAIRIVLNAWVGEKMLEGRSPQWIADATGWLVNVVYRRAHEHRRANKEFTASFHTNRARAAEDPDERTPVRDDQRAAFVLFEQGLTLAEAALKLGEPENALANRLSLRNREPLIDEKIDEWLEPLFFVDMSLLEIARTIGWPKWRLQQWFHRRRKSDPEWATRLEETRQKRNAEAAAAHEEYLLATAVDVLTAAGRGTLTPGELRDALCERGLRRNDLNEALRVVRASEHRSLLRPVMAYARKWTPDNVAVVLRRCANELDVVTLSSAVYVEWRAAQEDLSQIPPLSSICGTCGSWAAACERAGLTAPAANSGRVRPPVCRMAAEADIVLNVPKWWPTHPDFVSQWVKYVADVRRQKRAANRSVRVGIGDSRTFLAQLPGSPAHNLVIGLWSDTDIAETWAERVWGADHVTHWNDLVPVGRRWVTAPAPDPDVDRDRHETVHSWLRGIPVERIDWRVVTSPIRQFTSPEPTSPAPRLTWGQAYERLALWTYHTGTPNVPQDYMMSDGFRLGRWVHNQRTAYRMQANGQNRSISPHRVAVLERLPGWSWKTAPARHTGVEQSTPRNTHLPMDELITRYVEGRTFTQIGQEYGVSASTVRKRFKTANLPLRRGPVSADVDEALTDEHRAVMVAVLQGIANGVPFGVTAAEHGWPVHEVKVLFKWIGVPLSAWGPADRKARSLAQSAA